MSPASIMKGKCQMTMYFHWNAENECILFESWRPENTVDYIFAAIFLILICLMREYVIYCMSYYEIRSLTGRYVPFWPSNETLDELMNINNFSLSSNYLMTKSKIPRDHWRNPITLKLRIVDTILYGISLTLGYALMLIIMTFNIGLMIIIVIGYCLGRFIFHKQSKILSRYAVVKMNNEFSDTDHCHVRS